MFKIPMMLDSLAAAGAFPTQDILARLPDTNLTKAENGRTVDAVPFRAPGLRRQSCQKS